MDLTATTRLVVSHSATGAVHAMTVTDRDLTGRAVCGSDKTLPRTADLEATGDVLLDATIALNDLHLGGLVKVCQPCRARLSVAALA